MTVLSAPARARVLRTVCQERTIEVSGDSMEPTLKSGDRILVDVDVPARFGDIVVFVGNDEQTIVHRLVGRCGRRRLCLGDNRHAVDPMFELSSIVGVAKAIVDGDGQQPLSPMVGLAKARLFRRALAGAAYVSLTKTSRGLRLVGSSGDAQ